MQPQPQTHLGGSLLTGYTGHLQLHLPTHLSLCAAAGERTWLLGGAAWGPYQHLPQNTFFKETKVLKTLIITLEFCVLLAPLLHSRLPDILPCLLGRLLQHLWVVWLGQLSPLLWCMRLTGSSTRLLSQPRAVASAPGPLSCAGHGHLRR